MARMGNSPGCIPDFLKGRSSYNIQGAEWKKSRMQTTLLPSFLTPCSWGGSQMGMEIMGKLLLYSFSTSITSSERNGATS